LGPERLEFHPASLVKHVTRYFGFEGRQWVIESVGMISFTAGEPLNGPSPYVLSRDLPMDVVGELLVLKLPQ